MQQLEGKVINVRETQIPNPNGGVQEGILVTYNVGEHGPFTITLPKTGFDPAAARARIEETVAKIRAITATPGV